MASDPEDVARALEQYDEVETVAVVGDELAVTYDGPHRTKAFHEAARNGYVADSLSTTGRSGEAEVYFVKASKSPLDPSVETEVYF